jgi:[CysO sulfur-carrier protein]-S-L-cysteine hydrolase
VRLSRAQWDELLAHAREESPNECCGYMSLRDGSVAEVVRGTSKRRSPYGYELDDESLRAVNFDLEDHGFDVAVYHSHPKSEAEPSQTDINLAYYPGWLYVIVAPTKDDVRAWWIQDGKVREEEVEVED